MLQKSRIIFSRFQQAVNINSLKKTSLLSKGYQSIGTQSYGLIQKQFYYFSSPNNNLKDQANYTDADYQDREAKRKQELEDQEAQRQFILEQIEQKRKFDELFNIFVEKKKDEMRIVRLYKYYRKKYKNQAMNLSSFFMLNVVLIIAILILPSKEFNVQKAFQMRFVNIISDLVFYLQKTTSDDDIKSQSLISPKKYISFVFLALKYMERNDIFDLDFLIKSLHNITLIIYKQSENEKSIDRSNIKASISNEKDSTHMIIGTLMNYSEIIKESIQVRPHIFLEKDFQEVLTDYLEIVSMNSEELAQVRRNFLNSKENLLNSDQYQYFIQNQLSLNQLVGVLLLYNPKDKMMVYDCLERIFRNNSDWNDYLVHFLENYRLQLYKDVANQSSEQAQKISVKSFKLVAKLFENKDCQKRLIQDKLLSNLIKLFILKQNNMHEQEIKAIVRSIASNKEILVQKESQQFRDEFTEFDLLRNSKNKKVKEILEPLYK